MTEKTNYFKFLSQINVNDHVEKKNGLSYLSWAWAWAFVKTYYPESYATIYEDTNGRFWFDDGKTGWVKTGFTIVYYDEENNRHSQENIEYLPIMDFRNASIPADKINSTDANKAIQRSLTKAISRTGLGCYIYAGEDLPMESEEDKELREVNKKNAEEAKTAIKSELARITKEMSATEKKSFAENTIKPAVGSINYTVCTDADKLTELLNKLKNM